MDRADRAGLGVAVAGHLVVLGLLSVGLAKQVTPVRPVQEAMDVQLVDAVGLQSAAPNPAIEAPRQMEAPDAGVPAEAAPAPTIAPLPSPTPPTPPLASPAPTPPKPAKPDLIAPVAPKAAPPAKPAPARLNDILKDVRSAAKSEQSKSAGSGKAERAAADRVGADFLKGVLNASSGKGERARATVSGAALNGLAAAIKRQVQPCYDLGGLAGTPAMQIVTVLQMRFNQDGSVSGTPQLVEQQGVNAANQAYARQMVEVSRRAVLRCAPLKLPAELYEGGWESIAMGFIPGQMR